MAVVEAVGSHRTRLAPSIPGFGPHRTLSRALGAASASCSRAWGNRLVGDQVPTLGGCGYVQERPGPVR